MKQITIEAIPNQKFTVPIDKNRYTIELKTAGTIMCVSISRNDSELIGGFRCVSNGLLIPYPYLEDGNFVFKTENDDLPWWEKFGVTQSLIYVTNSDLVTLRASL